MDTKNKRLHLAETPAEAAAKKCRPLIEKLEGIRKRTEQIKNTKASSKKCREVILWIKKHRKAEAAAAVICLVAMTAVRITGEINKRDVYAASAQSVGVQTQSITALPTGLAGVISGVTRTDDTVDSVQRIGTSCEEVIVGQRTLELEEASETINISESMTAAVDTLHIESIVKAERAAMMSDTDYETLLRIVEAEAGGEDLKGKILVANVIMNRVAQPQFPDTITEVVWDNSGGAPQFSPTYDGRIGTVTVSEETKDAVRQAMEGTDYSEGALFFVAKDQAEKENVAWFDKDLKHLFEHGVHNFYTFPEDGSAR